MLKSKIIGVGSYLPAKIITNDDLAKTLDTNDEWIRTRTGISQRHVAKLDELTADMALKAANDAINNANISLSTIDLVINCTTTPDHIFPGIGVKLASLLNLKYIPAFDLQAVCSGFIYGLEVADNMIKSGKYKTVLLTCSEKMSKLLNWQDRSTCILFGDGAGAVILQSTEGETGLIDSNIYADGSFYDLLYVSDQGVKMNGREIFKAAVEKMASSIEELLKKNNLTVNDISYFVPHQANLRIIESLANRLKMNLSQIVITIAKHANCSAASIPLAFKELERSCKIKQGDLILFSAFGAGASWGSAIYRSS